MVGQNGEEHFRQIPAGYFDLIVVDECHRGSVKEDSNWRKVLEYFSEAIPDRYDSNSKGKRKGVEHQDYFVILYTNTA